MQLFRLTLLSATTAAVHAYTHGPHPGTFVGFLTHFSEGSHNYCQTPLGSTTIALSVPAQYYNPPDESPCDSTANITNTCTGKTIAALVVGDCTACANNDIQLNAAGLEALAPDGNKAHAPGTVVWTFND